MKKNIIVPLVIGTLIITGFFVLGGPSFFQPFETQVVTAATSTVTVTLTVTEEISLTPPSAITMSPALSLTATSSIGTGNAWNVKTNSQNGYLFTLKDDGAPALIDSGTSESFADYATSSPTTWNVTSGNYQFGFSVYGNDVGTGVWGTGASCGTSGIPTTTQKYSGFNGTTAITVATSTTESPAAGTNTIMCVAAAQVGIFAPNGTYTTTVTGTATVN